MNNTLLSSAFGAYQLHRYPPGSTTKGRQQTLRAWDAADEYLLQWLKQQIDEQRLPESPNTLVINDSFGALTVSLNQWPIQSQSDSFIAHQGCRQNLTANGIDDSRIELLPSLESPTGPFELVIIKIPKTLALLEDQLYRLRPSITSNSLVVAAAMSKHIHNSTMQLFESILGPTQTSLAQKKARLIFCQPLPEIWQGQSPYPTSYPMETGPYQLWNHANVFSRSSLDIGTRLFLKHFPDLTGAADIIDLGCGNGVLGLTAKLQQPGASIHFYDESYMAVASAEKTVREALGSTAGCHFSVNNCLQEVAPESVDAVLNNPPFHQQNLISDHIAWQMFKDARRVLKPGGSLFVIGNRHLGYHHKLKKLFRNCHTLASDSKFVILKSTL